MKGLNFREWFLDEAVSIRALYHGTMTGKDNSALNSFKTNGILPPHADSGQGQGGGFYVFSDFNKAADHAVKLKQRVDSGNFSTFADTDGSPMVVQINAILHPQDYDIDYEANAPTIIQFIHNHKDMFLNLVDPDNSDYSYSHNINRAGRQGINIRGQGTMYTDTPELGAAEGAALAQVWKQLKAKNPEFDHAFKTAFFDNLVPGIALKYVGDKRIKPAKIVVYQNNQWVPA